MCLSNTLPKCPKRPVKVVENSNYGEFAVLAPNPQNGGISPQSPNI